MAGNAWTCTMARWETSVLESQNQLYPYPDCFFIDAKNWWLMGFRYRKKTSYIEYLASCWLVNLVE